VTGSEEAAQTPAMQDEYPNKLANITVGTI